MAWVQVFPTGSTLISQSVAQIQANWLFLQNNINTDHYFNDPAHEGHHRFSQYFSPGGDPALVADGAIYTKNMGNIVITPQPFFLNSTGPRQMLTFFSGVTNLNAGDTSLFTTAAILPPFYGWIHIVNASVPNDYATGFIFWNGGATVTVRQLFVNGAITSITGQLTSVRAGSGGGITVQWAVYTIPL